MKKISIALFALAISFSAIAQHMNERSQKKHDRKEQRHDRLKNSDDFKKLDLTESQKSQIKSINENFRQQMKDLRSQGNITVNEQKQKREALMNDRKSKIAAILTPAQRNEAANKIEEYKKDRKNGMGKDRFKDVTKGLDLSPDQSAKMATINSNFKSNIQSIKQNNSLSQEQKKEQMMRLMKQHRSDMEDLLTNDQKQQLKSRHKNRPNRTIVK